MSCAVLRVPRQAGFGGPAGRFGLSPCGVVNSFAMPKSARWCIKTMAALTARRYAIANFLATIQLIDRLITDLCGGWHPLFLLGFTCIPQLRARGWRSRTTLNRPFFLAWQTGRPLASWLCRGRAGRCPLLASEAQAAPLTTGRISAVFQFARSILGGVQDLFVRHGLPNT